MTEDYRGDAQSAAPRRGDMWAEDGLETLSRESKDSGASSSKIQEEIVVMSTALLAHGGARGMIVAS